MAREIDFLKQERDRDSTMRMVRDSVKSNPNGPSSRLKQRS